MNLVIFHGYVGNHHLSIETMFGDLGIDPHSSSVIPALTSDTPPSNHSPSF